MATQTDVQALIQSLVPSSVNNGNPNTVYNNPAVPMTTGAGEWYIPQVNPAANLAGINLNLPIWQAPATGGGFTLPRNLINFTGTTIDPNWVPTINTPGGVGTGTPVTTIPSAGGSGYTSTGGNGTGWSGDLITAGPGNSPHATNGGGTSYNPVGGWSGNVWDLSSGLARQTGANADGSYSWQQIADMAQDVLMPIGIMDAFGNPQGNNWYLSQGGYENKSGSWDISNVLASLGTAFTGLPVNTILSKLGQFGAGRGWSENNLFVNHYLDNVTNELRNFGNQINNQMSQQTSELAAKSIADSLARAGLAAPIGQRMDNAMSGVQSRINSNAAHAARGGAFFGGAGASGRQVSDLASGIRGGADVVTGAAAQAMFGGLAAGADSAIKAALAARAAKSLR